MSTIDLVLTESYLMILKENLDLTLKWLQLIFVFLRDMARNPRNISHSLFLSRQFCFRCSECTTLQILKPRYFISTFEILSVSKRMSWSLKVLRSQLSSLSVSHREVVIFIFCLNCCRGRKVTRHCCAHWLALSHFITISAQAKKWSEAVVAHLNNSSKYKHILKKILNF